MRLKFPSLKFKLRICGEGERKYKLKLINLINKTGVTDEVEFLGFNKNWHALSNLSDCLVLPSKSEGTANVVLEALSIGLPVIISNIVMSKTLLTHKVNALVVSRRDPKEWADNIIYLNKQKILVKKIKENGIELSKKFSIPNMVRGYESVYEELHISLNQ